jgi:hypothetical protein
LTIVGSSGNSGSGSGSVSGTGELSDNLIDCGGHDFGFDDIAHDDEFCACSDDEWIPSLCGAPGSGAVSTIVRTVATGQTIIPAT